MKLSGMILLVKNIINISLWEGGVAKGSELSHPNLFTKQFVACVRKFWAKRIIFRKIITVENNPSRNKGS